MFSIKKFIASEKEKLKDYSFKEILEYFWEYYKGITITSIVIIVMLISMFAVVFGGNETAINGVLLNCYPKDEGTILFNDFPEYAGLDRRDYDFGFSANQYFMNDKSVNDIYTMQALMASVAAGGTDFFTADWSSMEPLCYQSVFFADLRTVLPEDTLEKLSDRIYYADNSVLTQIQQSEDRVEDVKIPDPKQPEKMKEPFPVAIDLQGCEKLSELYPIHNKGTCFAFVCTSQNRENTITFLNYLLGT